MDYKPLILDALTVLYKRDLANKEPFKARAYQQVIQQLKYRDEPVQSYEDLQGMKGLGEKIQKKIKEILETGQLATAEKAKEVYHLESLDVFQKIYGVGPTKATALVGAGYRTIQDLRDAIKGDKTLLNTNQTVGLQYYEALLERIPRAEMVEHEDIIKHYVKDAELVGSYRRRAADSGDIDVLIRVPTGTTASQCKEQLAKYVKQLKEVGYIQEVLALGGHKCMAICRTDDTGTARRLDLLMTPEEEYAYALLYFTGSDRFNVAFRQHALKKGLTLNEHRMEWVQVMRSEVPALRSEVPALRSEVPALRSEKDIFDYLGLRYVEPWDRVTQNVEEKPKKPVLANGKKKESKE
jgi:DNA polymerase/3'-5' exonuclease PolX